MKKNNIFTVIALIILFFGVSCDKDIIEGAKYRVEQKADLKDLLVVTHADHIFGIDTVSFTVKAHIYIRGMVFGGVAKMPDGGIVFTHFKSGTTWGNKMYVVNRNCDLVQKVKVCDAPMAPKVHNGRIYIGSSVIEGSNQTGGVKFKFQVYDAGTFAQLGDFLYPSMLDAWKLIGAENEVYFPVDPNENYSSPGENSYIVKMDSETSDTSTIRFNDEFAADYSLVLYKQADMFYIFNLSGKMAAKYDATQQKVLVTKDLNEYPLLSEHNFWNIAFPKVKGEYLYGFLGGGWNETTDRQLMYWVKLSADDLSLLDYKPIDKYEGTTHGSDESYEGSYFVRCASKNTKKTTHVQFIDYTTGEIVQYVKLQTDKYYD